MLSLRLGVILAAFTLLNACASAREAYRMADVVSQSKAGQAPANIISDIRAAKTSYALRGSDFGKLKSVGVSDELLDYIQQSFVGDVDLLTRYWVLGESLGKCGWCYPQEVNFAGLQSGQAPTQSPPPMRMLPSQPLGVPSWYEPWTSGFSTKHVSLAQLRDMAKQGASEADMLAVLRGATPERVVGVGGITYFSTRPLGGLSGSELAQLRADGVPDSVLDALQTRFLSAYVENARLRYQNYGKGARP
jgi:hypothetical protein